MFRFQRIDIIVFYLFFEKKDDQRYDYLIMDKNNF